MTQSGQGEEPSARPAREGIVLPSDGGEPLLPGMTGGPADRPVGPQHGARPGGPTPASAPPGGQAWGQPWGPEQHQAPAPPPGQDWQTPPAEPWSSPQQPAPWGAQDQPGPLPQEGAHGQSYGGGAQQSYGGGSEASYGGGAQASYGAYGTPGQGAASLPAPGASAPLPPAGHGAPGASLPAVDDGATQYIPPVAAASGDEGATQYIPPVGGAQYHAPGAPDGATQYIPPVASGPADEGATQYLPPVPASGPASADEGATQYIPPVGPGALPPEMPSGGPADRPAETTTYLRRAREGGAAGAGPLPAASGADAEATQYIPPVSGQGAYGDRQPPAEFDNLFRGGPGGGSGQAGATQHMPRYQGPQGAGHAATQPSYAAPGPDRGRRASRDGGRRTGSKVPLIAACGVAIAVVGIGAGALLADGGGAEKNDDPKPVSATAPATAETSAAPSADPAEQQAVALDKLLADSGDSRATVINAVNEVKSCGNLAQAAKDLRGAAEQRNNLVTQLSGLSVDKLPDHAALTAALNKAWKASASADNHYAAWADQVAGQKGKLCKKGQARATGQTAAGNRESGIATTQKAEAAKLWNAIARTYGLTERQPTQL
ncbi:hypothetical protein I2W78_22085 [Streptomyces spinoverrucosus]|uniref:hypothetical protein n=1 Tax=Streptomyces spinoverrucosus TaxID=284043 RepID=UPI0018C3D66E|nr:hypothetical protein [Streptomyces spinoverrucosus]MBG0854454.1 hypothetical protein [Streptomyces spinoverrucosus]